jgi:glycosyltransferase involved in cell wall biosynthesis
LRPYVSRYIGRFHQRSARTYTPSAPARDDLRALGVRDIEIWGRGVDIDTFHPRHRSDALRAAYGRPNTCLLVHVGRLAAEKGVDRILAAYRIARAQLPAGAVHLVIAGAGPREDALRADAPDGVTFLGNLDRASDLPRLYASGDAFIFASHTETLGLVVLEAMASALPVIAAPAGGVADHLRDSENGIAYPPGDIDQFARAIVRVVLDPAQRRALGARARITAESLSWTREFTRLDESYREVCRRASSPIGLPIGTLAAHA